MANMNSTELNSSKKKKGAGSANPGGTTDPEQYSVSTERKVMSGSGAAAEAAPAAASETAEAPTVALPETDALAGARYDEALRALRSIEGAAPQYTSRYDEQIQSLYEQITGRKPFRYDSETDPLYRQYAQRYMEQGALAMRDTMGRAAALTGGYGSSYAQSVGQQQYDAYLQRLADVLPETYGLALKSYESEGEGLEKKLAAARSLEQTDYGRYLDALGEHKSKLERARSDESTAYARMIDADERGYRRRSAAEQDAYARLLRLIAAGYMPNAKELAAARMTEAQARALMG